MRARIIDRWQELESGAAVPIAAAAPKLLPIDLLEQAQALKTLLGDDELKRLAPLLWQEIADGAQNAMRRALGAPLALPAPDAPKPLDVVEIAKAAGIELPQNLRGAAGKYVKARVAHIETERIIAGSIRKSAAYCDHAAVADALREYLGKRAASQVHARLTLPAHQRSPPVRALCSAASSISAPRVAPNRRQVSPAGALLRVGRRPRFRGSH